MEYLCVATPEFIDQYFPVNTTKTSLERAPAVIFSTKDKLHEQYLTQYFKMKAGSWREHKIPKSESFLEAIIQGMGYGLVGHLQAEPLIEKGVLVEVTPSKRKRIPLYWQHWNLKAKQTTIVYRSLAVTAKQSLCRS